MSKSDETYSTVEKIRSAFLKGELSSREAVDEFAKKQTQKAWHTKGWRALRQKLIKDKCQQCGTSETPMVLQHMWHPDTLSHTIRDITRKYEHEYSKEHPHPALKPPAPEGIRDGCPGCGKFSGFNWRKTHENWRCGHCKIVFSELIKIPVLTYEQYEVYDAQLKELEEQWGEAFWAETEDAILSEALHVGFEQNDRYISCVDTVTFCRKCAFMWDKNKKKMCEVCGHWIPNYIKAESCFYCLDKLYGLDKVVERLYTQYEHEA